MKWEQVGYTQGIILDASRQSWDNASSRPIKWSAWYPCHGVERVTAADTLHGEIFDLGAICLNAAPDQTAASAIILMSHGTGGSAESLGWLARQLASGGALVLAVNHHGNTAKEPYAAEGFFCWWERALDLSFLLTHMKSDPLFCLVADKHKVHILGYSLGVHTVLMLLGARTSMQDFSEFARQYPQFASGPREFPDLAERMKFIRDKSASFKASLDRQSDDFHDPRISSAFAIAPPPPVRALDCVSIRAITTPLTILAGEVDEEAPFELGAAWLKQQNPHFDLQIAGCSKGHYDFVGSPSAFGLRVAGDFFGQTPPLQRSQVHDFVLHKIRNAFRLNGTLTPR